MVAFIPLCENMPTRPMSRDVSAIQLTTGDRGVDAHAVRADQSDIRGCRQAAHGFRLQGDAIGVTGFP